jgi:tol-pal system protein YbgF
MGRPLALVIVVIVAAGCATRASYHRLGTDVATLRGEVTDLRQAQESTARDLARTAGETRALDARLSELNTAHKDAVAEVAALRGRLDAAETEIRDAKLAAAPPAAAAAPPAAARPTAARPTATPPPAAERPREPAARAENPEQAYQAALAMFRAREYGQAVLDFLDFIAKHPRHPLAANAQYWIGEAYYVQRDYRQALAEFQKVIDVAAASAKVPDALLKMGLCYRSLRDENHARQTWDRVAKDYPKSEAATKARALLRSRGATARR